MLTNKLIQRFPFKNQKIKTVAAGLLFSLEKIYKFQLSNFLRNNMQI